MREDYGALYCTWLKWSMQQGPMVHVMIRRLFGMISELCFEIRTNEWYTNIEYDLRISGTVSVKEKGVYCIVDGGCHRWATTMSVSRLIVERMEKKKSIYLGNIWGIKRQI